MSDYIVINNDKLSKEYVLNTNKPIFMIFHAEWCNPSKLSIPSIEKLIKKYHNKYKFIKIDVDKNPNIASKYNVKGIPNFILIENGCKNRQKHGFMDYSDMENILLNV